MPLNSDCDLVESCAPPPQPRNRRRLPTSIHVKNPSCPLSAPRPVLAALDRGRPASKRPGRPSTRNYNVAMLRAKLELGLNGREFCLVVGDITKIPADAIGNAANARLAGGGGVDGAIHRVGGPAIMRELDEIRQQVKQCPAGGVVITGAGNLPAQWVLHAVGPVYEGGQHGEAQALRSCYQQCLALSDQLGARTLTLPAISTGVYGYPLAEAARIAVSAVLGALHESETTLQRVTIVLFDKPAFREFATAAFDTLMPLAP